MREIFGFLLIMLCVAILMAIAEFLHRKMRAPMVPLRPTSQGLENFFSQGGEERYSVRHLERFFLVAFVWLLLFFLIVTLDKSAPLETFLSMNSIEFAIVPIAAVGVWWAYRRGTLR